MTAICAKSSTLLLKQCNGLKPGLLLSDSGLTPTWLLGVLWENCEEFRTALDNGVVHNVGDCDGVGHTAKKI